MERSARGAWREFALYGGEDALDQRSERVLFGGEMFSHLEAHTRRPATGAPFGRNDTVSLQLLAAEGMVALGIGLGVGQHAADGRVPLGTAHQRGQRGAVIPRRLPRPLSQNQLPFQVHYSQPLQPMCPGALGLAEMLDTANKIAARRTLRQACGIDAYRGSPSPPPGHAPHHLLQGAIDVVGLQPRQKAIQRGVVGNGAKLQGETQLRVFAEPHLSFAEGPVFIAHQAEHGQQLRLRELVLAKRRAIPRHRGMSNAQRHARKSHQPYFGHRKRAKPPEQLQLKLIPANSRTTASRMSTEPPALLK